MWVYATLLVVNVLVDIGYSQSPSPCPELFQYVKQNQPGRWEGLLTLAAETDLYGVWARLIFDSPSTGLTTENFGEVVTTDQKEYLIKNRDYVLKAGVPLKLKIVVRYDGNKVPSLTGFRLNARIVCPITGEPITWVDNTKPQFSDEFYLGDSNNKDFLPSKPTRESAIECGTVALPQGTITNGRKTSEGLWPWHATIYFKINQKETYGCAATLISNTHVITAAHCVTQKKTKLPINKDNVYVYLGKFYLQQNSQTTQQIAAADIKIHPEYDAQNLRNDLAIIRLKTPVRLSPYVRPVCLWDETGNSVKLPKGEGSLIGWGYDNQGRITDRLTQVKIKATNLDKCKKPGLVDVISDKTLCGTFTQNNEICAGNSGSGLVYLREGQKPVWQLRGVLYVSAILQDNYVCDESNSVAFTDITKYSKWISQSIV